MRKRIIALASVVALVGALGLITTDVPSQRQDSQEIGLGVKITQINGVPIQDGKVISAGNFNVLPGVIYHDNKFLDDTLEDYVVEVGLDSLVVLREWGLCEAELHAQAQIDRGIADAVFAYPHDAPLERADKNGNVTSDDVAWAETLQSDAERYDRAAALARTAGLPCEKAGAVLGEGNYARLTGVDKDGDSRTIDVPDYRVVSLPVEYFVLEHECATELTGRLRELKATPVDVKIGKRGGLDTFSQRDKADGMSRLKAEVVMVQMAKVPC
ncbi:MAG: hypothetical protein JWP06_764 [Candidatus Saccharibacteria bacterium]|nr:hypothetical protein [Candidatus Saccharibacteria bacterium]